MYVANVTGTYPSKVFKRYLQSLAADILLERSEEILMSAANIFEFAE